MAKKFTIQYRQLKSEGLPKDFILKDAIVASLHCKKEKQFVYENARLRIIDLDQDKSFVILNKLSAKSSWTGSVFAGQLIQIQAKSDLQAVIQSLEHDTSEFILKKFDVGESAVS